MPVGRGKVLILIKQLIMILIGISCGGIVAAGVFTFITMIGVIPRLAARTDTAKHILIYEDMIIIGGTLANIAQLFRFPIPIGVVGLIIYGIFSGIFVGCLAIALAEVLQVIPIFASRINLRRGMSFIVIAMAFGKTIGSMYQLYWNVK